MTGRGRRPVCLACPDARPSMPMSTPEKPAPPATMTLSGEHATALFERAWGLYDAIAAGNHMSHRELYPPVADHLRRRSEQGAYSLLDLGCGDARFLAPCLQASPPSAYTGVDLSEAALSLARSRLSHLPSARCLREDMVRHLAESQAATDVIFSSYALHHLATSDKRAAFRHAARLITPGGSMLLIDVVREPGQSREDYIDDYLRRIRDDWKGLTREMVDEACAHVASFDHPESLATLDTLALDAGLSAGRLHAKFGPHTLVEFTKPSAAS